MKGTCVQLRLAVRSDAGRFAGHGGHSSPHTHGPHMRISFMRPQVHPSA
jgi:hypothetical protein